MPRRYAAFLLASRSTVPHFYATIPVKTYRTNIIEGDALRVLRRLPSQSINCCVTSPCYWGLRDYGVPGQMGLEKTPEEYVARLVDVFREVRRVLRDDGTLWLNLGDSYATGGGKVGDCPGGGKQGARYRGDHGADPKSAGIGPQTQPNRMPIAGLKPKDLVGIPWRVAFALQADGWYLRSDIIWHRPNPMPESVTDRPTKAHEYVFLLAKGAKYYYDAAAIAEPAKYPGDHGFPRGPIDGCDSDLITWRAKSQQSRKIAGVDSRTAGSETRNKRTVWTVTTKPFKGAHFATFPPKLIEPCILAGCPKGGIVLDCFAGAGTTGLVATQHGRRFIGIELNPKYAQMARERIEPGSAQLARTA